MLLSLLNSPHEPINTTKYDILMQLTELIKQHPNIKSIDCEAVIRHGIKQYTTETGGLWIALAYYYIEQGKLFKLLFIPKIYLKFIF